ncbi:MAG TPA: hypothetical protein VFL57_13740 [Bryobacteraceae bacterium]|nr:hypothetical protein [Bryobacteraceae bacterium]
MNENYLWDRSGPPDPEIADLEQVLGTLRYDKPLRARTRPRAWVWPSLAAAAAAATLIAVIIWPRPPAWEIARRGGKTVYYAEEVGQVEAAAGSDVRVLDSRRLRLRRGEIHAVIWAPPREFVVDTPSARAIDLGCEYTLSVAADGTGLLRVSTGWVAFQHRRLESFIPAGAACVTRARRGPGTPWMEDAPADLRIALNAFDERADVNALRRVLAHARSEDGLTLWHLLTRAPQAERGAVFDRFAQLVALPPEVTRDRIVASEPKAIDAAWNALKLENADWWREWKRSW